MYSLVSGYSASFYFPGDFLNPNLIYEDLTDFSLLKKYMEEQLEDYNMTPGVVHMELVLFKDAIEHSKL